MKELLNMAIVGILVVFVAFFAANSAHQLF